ncbi:MAG: beta-ketoacyl-[acyl-carrier-protein] synthase family protein [Leptospiraceae bacterium]|nr:beta-ketoacyl-[acyl-carrier-protein] synthase family protein [Leptospiraceae bacterium]MCP5513191.1 beta-ketoacyl-[acyl-carrier-protein] synthase family protein [Leptospiraceae bacterium]
MPKEKNSRVVITGIGSILPNAFSVEDFWDKIKNGNSQIDFITKFNTENFPIKIASEIKNFDYTKYLSTLSPQHAEHYNTETLAIMSAVEMAQKDAGLTKTSIDPTKVGFIDSSSRASLAWWEHAWQKYQEDPEKFHDIFNRYSVLMSMSSTPSTLTAIYNNIQGFVTCISAACVGGHHAISLCFQAIRKGRADVMYAGGHEFPILKPVMSMYSDPKSRVMSLESENPKNGLRPYNRDRDGFVLGEGAMALCLERYEHAVARGARIYAEVLGHLSYNESSHAFRMDMTGLKAANGMKKLLKISKRSLDDVGYFCGHGTATYNNDLAESRSIKLLYEDTPVSKWSPVGSIKPIFGHTFGGAGIINVAATALMLKNQTLCPTINLTDPDPNCDHDHVAEGPRPVKNFHTAVSLAFAIGSQSSFVCLGLPE